MSVQRKGCVTCSVHPLHPSCLDLHGNAVAVTPLVDSVEALSVLDGNVKLLTELLERLVRRQIQAVKAETEKEKGKENRQKFAQVFTPTAVRVT